MKITFFGASVTRQKGGMAEVFAAFNPDYKVSIHGHGGMYIRDAGVCYLSETLNDHSSYCFLDWLSPLPIAPDDETLFKCLDAQIFMLRDSLCEPIILLLHRYDNATDKKISQKRINTYKKVEEYAKQWNVKTINLYDAPEVLEFMAHNTLIKDYVHTTPEGSRFYGDIISREFAEIIKTKPSFDLLPQPNNFCSIRSLPVNKEFIQSIKICGAFTLIGIDQTIGPYSGKIKLKTDGDYAEEIIFNNWDSYCYYVRRHITYINKSAQNCIEIEILNENFDRGAAKEQVDWTQTPKMFIQNLFYTGKIDFFECK